MFDSFSKNMSKLSDLKLPKMLKYFFDFWFFFENFEILKSIYPGENLPQMAPYSICVHFRSLINDFELAEKIGEISPKTDQPSIFACRRSIIFHRWIAHDFPLGP